MVIAATALTSGNSGTNATSYATASVTPAADRLVLLAVMGSHASGSNVPTVTGNGLTWVQVKTAPLDESGEGSFFRRITVFRAMGGSPSSGAITVDFGGQTQLRCLWSVVEYSGIDTGGTNGSAAIVQSVSNDNNGAVAGSWSITLASFADAINNAGYGVLGLSTRQNITPGTGWTELHEEITPSGEDCTLQTQWQLGEDTTCDWSGWISSRPAAIAIEIAAASAVTVTPDPVVVEVDIVAVLAKVASVVPDPVVVEVDVVAVLAKVASVVPDPVVVEVDVVAVTVGWAVTVTPDPVVVEVDVVAVLAKVASVVPDPVVVEVDVVAVPVATGLAVTPDPVAVEVDIVAPGLGSSLSPDPVAVEVDLVAPALGTSLSPDPVAVEVDIVTPRLDQFIEQMEGVPGAIIEKPGGVAVTGLAGHIQAVIDWSTERYLNRVGSWTATIPAAEPAIDGDPLANQITRGWLVSLIQENTRPLNRLDLEFLLYRGIVEDKTYGVDESGQAVCTLSGSFRGANLATRCTPTTAAYTAQTLAAIAADIEGGLAGGISLPSNSTSTATISFNGGANGEAILSRYARLLRLGEYGRYALRETWEQDALEFVSVDAAPDSGYYLINQEAAGISQTAAAAAGFALIAGQPKISRRGGGIVNRIIPFGSDTPAAPLTLEHATRTQPYTVKTGTNPDASTYFYLEDTESINLNGLVEVPLHRTDIKNPSDNAGTRAQAANVLYAVTHGELWKNKAPKIFVEIAIANGPHVWALPGDKVTLQYIGNVETDDGDLVWQEFDQAFLVVERSDASTPDGVRAVTFVLAAPEREIPIPGLPDAISLPVAAAGVYAYGAGDLGGIIAGCCDDPNTDINVGPDDPFVPSVLSELVLYLHDGTTARFVLFDTTTETWSVLSTPPAGIVAQSGQLMALSDTLLVTRAASAGGGNYSAEQFRGAMHVSTDGGGSWSAATAPGLVGGLTYAYFHWAVIIGSTIWALWSDDASGAAYGNATGLFSSTDSGATWTTHFQNQAGAPTNLAEDAANLAHLLNAADGSPDLTIIDSHAVQLRDPALTFEQINGFQDIGVRKNEYAALLAWGADLRVLSAQREITVAPAPFTMASAINYSDKDAGAWTWTGGYLYGYQPGVDHGRCSGIVRAPGTEILFAAWEDGTVIRSLDNGATWAEMSLAATFSEIHGMAYHAAQDSLWVAGKDASNAALVHGWSQAMSTSGDSFDATYDLNDIASPAIGANRGAGHLGLIVREAPAITLTPTPVVVEVDVVAVT